jgi:hypothetical protein
MTDAVAPTVSLHNAIDKLENTNLLLQALTIGLQTLGQPDRDPMSALAFIIRDRLEEVSAELDAIMKLERASA